MGCGATGRSTIDVYDRRAERWAGIRLVSLDTHTGAGLGDQPDGWREWLAEDNRVSPAAEPCFRLDFAAWLDGRLPKKPRSAGLLVEGHETGVPSRMLLELSSALSSPPCGKR